ncbi:MAG: HNH endonuclease, partial [Nitrospirae bacterium]|nr:HNH endonuclease [Nitrospirota bacterium]
MTDEPFRFEIDRVKTHASRAEIVASLREYGRLHQCETFGMREYDDWKNRLVTSDTIRRQFGSWAKALHEAGFRAVRGQKVDPAAMVEAFRACWKEQRSVPSLTQLEAFLERKKYPFRVKTYGTFFGGVGRLAKRIVQAQNGELSEADLLRRVERKRPTRLPISQKLRYAILKRDREQCMNRGASPKKNSEVTLEVDHIIPVAEGGT